MLVQREKIRTNFCWIFEAFNCCAFCGRFNNFNIFKEKYTFIHMAQFWGPNFWPISNNFYQQRYFYNLKPAQMRTECITIIIKAFVSEFLSPFIYTVNFWTVNKVHEKMFHNNFHLNFLELIFIGQKCFGIVF